MERKLLIYFIVIINIMVFNNSAEKYFSLLIKITSKLLFMRIFQNQNKYLHPNNFLSQTFLSRYSDYSN